MLSIKTWKNSDSARDYYTEEQHQVEYYASDNEHPAEDSLTGSFHGLESLGIKDGAEVDKNQFHLLLLGHSPTGEKLFSIKQNENPSPEMTKTLEEVLADISEKKRLHDEKEKEKQAQAHSLGQEVEVKPFRGHRPGYDLTFSAPKSVSILWALGDKETKEKIMAAQNKAVTVAMQHIEEYAGKTRRGEGGKFVESVSKLMFAKFHHATSRANDPHLHTHTMVFNAALLKEQEHDSKGSKYGAIESSYIFSEAMTAGAIYRSELAHELEHTLGYACEKVESSFEVKGVDKELIDLFSSRRQSILAELKSKGYSSAKSAEIAALSTRNKKEKLPFREVLATWKEQAKNFNLANVFTQSKPTALEKKELLASELNDLKVMDELSQHKSTFSEHDLRKIIAQKLQTLSNYSDFKSNLERLKTSQEKVFVGKDDNQVDRYSDKRLHTLEKNVVATLTKAKEKYQLSITAQEVDDVIKDWEKRTSLAKKKPIQLTDEQRQMVHGLVFFNSSNTKVVEGIAGSGKSFSLEIVKEIYEAQGVKVIGLAPTGKASVGLEQSTKIKSMTIDRFIKRYESRKQAKPKDKSVIIIDESGMVGSKKMAKLVEIGEKLNAKFMLVGDTRQLQPVEAGAIQAFVQTEIKPIELKTVYRQSEDWQKESTTLLAEGKAKAALAKYLENDQIQVFGIAESAHRAIVEDYIADMKAAPAGTRVIIAETNRQTKILNDHIREDLIAAKKIGKNHSLTITNRLAEKEHREFSTGDRIVFTKNSPDVSNGTFGTITKLRQVGEGFEVKVRCDSGKEVTINTASYNHIEHGYAVTVYKSQGDTVDKTFLLMSEKTSKESAYVALSRHSKNAKIYVDRTCFSDLIDWDGVKNEKNEAKKLEKIAAGTVNSVSKQAEKSQLKDTSLSYGIEIS